jgi:hypothetical protein
VKDGIKGKIEIEYASFPVVLVKSAKGGEVKTSMGFLLA